MGTSVARASRLFVACVAVLGSLASATVDARAQAAAPDRRVRIRRVTGLGRAALLRTPAIEARGAGVARRPSQDWAECSVVFDTTPDWMDALEVEFFVLAKDPATRETPYSFYRRALTCVDLERGPEHVAAVYLPPRTLKRYGEIVAVGVEIRIDGKVVAEMSQKGAGETLPDDWWRRATITGDKRVVTRDGYLLPRSRTPFAVINPDDYEMER